MKPDGVLHQYAAGNDDQIGRLVTGARGGEIAGAALDVYEPEELPSTLTLKLAFSFIGAVCGARRLVLPFPWLGFR
jgi:phosphoglycerate dehydrogenase-like enzyme